MSPLTPGWPSSIGAKGADEALGALLLELRQAGVRNIDVLRAIETVPREIFVPFRLRDLAGKNCPLPIGCGQTMEAPGALALMLEALDIHQDHRVMEIGAGSGYSTATLARLARDVVSFERFHSLATEARGRLEQLGVVNAIIHCDDGLAEPEPYGRFDRILIHALLSSPPERALSLLAPGGLLLCALEDRGADEAISGGWLCLIAQSDHSVRRLGKSSFGAVLSGVSQAL